MQMCSQVKLVLYDWCTAVLKKIIGCCLCLNISQSVKPSAMRNAKGKSKELWAACRESGGGSLLVVSHLVTIIMGILNTQTHAWLCLSFLQCYSHPKPSMAPSLSASVCPHLPPCSSTLIQHTLASCSAATSSAVAGSAATSSAVAVL